MTEEWRPVVGWEDCYEVSSLGRIRSLPKIRGLECSRGGYPIVRLTRNKKSTSKTVHGIVAAAFLGPRPSGHDVNHKDGDKKNNGAVNLEYMTKLQNITHAMETGLRDPAKLSHDDVRAIRKLTESGWSCVRIGRVFGVSNTTVHRIRRREIWAHVDPA